MTSFIVPIRSVNHELQAWRRPPEEVNPQAHLQAAVDAMHGGRPAEALHFVENALKLDEGWLASPTASLRPPQLATARNIIDAAAAADPPVAARARAALDAR